MTFPFYDNKENSFVKHTNGFHTYLAYDPSRNKAFSTLEGKQNTRGFFFWRSYHCWNETSSTKNNEIYFTTICMILFLVTAYRTMIKYNLIKQQNVWLKSIRNSETLQSRKTPKSPRGFHYFDWIILLYLAPSSQK